jgi:hypothetical protein
MTSKIYAFLCVLGLIPIIIFSNCSITHHYDFSLKNTLSIFLLNNEKGYYFCIPIQYVGDYQIENFNFNSGYVLIGDYEISLKKDEINVFVYLDEATDEFENSDGEFNLVYFEKNSRIISSKMDEPLTIKHEPDERMNYYYIFIERFLNNDEVKKMANEYEKGNVYSHLNIEYDITIDNEQQTGSGIRDDFELHDGFALDPAWFPPNLNFFKSRYLQK